MLARSSFRPILRSRRDRSALSTIHMCSFSMSGQAPPIQYSDSNTNPRPVHCICSTPNAVALCCNVYGAISPLEAQGPVSCCERLFWASIIYLCIHDREQGRLRRYVFQQELDRCWTGDVFSQGDQPDGKGDVWVSRVASERRSRRSRFLRDSRSQGLRTKRCLSFICSPATPRCIRDRDGYRHSDSFPRTRRPHPSSRYSSRLRSRFSTHSHDATRLTSSSPSSNSLSRSNLSQQTSSAVSRYTHVDATVGQGYAIPWLQPARPPHASFRGRIRRSNHHRLARLPRYLRRSHGYVKSQLCSLDEFRCLDASQIKNGSRPVFRIPLSDSLVKTKFDPLISCFISSHPHLVSFLSILSHCIKLHIRGSQRCTWTKLPPLFHTSRSHFSFLALYLISLSYPYVTLGTLHFTLFHGFCTPVDWHTNVTKMNKI